jgi:hypothetical protein
MKSHAQALAHAPLISIVEPHAIPDMHASLAPIPNIIMVAAWIAGIVAVSFIAPQVPLALLAFGVLFGAALGILQRRAIRASRVALIASQSAMDVRRALAATGSGRAYLYALWGSVLMIVAAAYALPAGGDHFGAIAGYLALASVRELITLREAFVLEALAVGPTASRGV